MTAPSWERKQADYQLCGSQPRRKLHSTSGQCRCQFLVNGVWCLSWLMIGIGWTGRRGIISLMNTIFCWRINFLNMFPKVLFLLANINSCAMTLTPTYFIASMFCHFSPYQSWSLHWFPKLHQAKVLSGKVKMMLILFCYVNKTKQRKTNLNLFFSSSWFDPLNVWKRCCGWRKLCSAELHRHDWGWASHHLLDISWSGDLQWPGHPDLPHRQPGQHADHLQCRPQTLGRVHMHRQEWSWL